MICPCMPLRAHCRACRRRLRPLTGFDTSVTKPRHPRQRASVTPHAPYMTTLYNTLFLTWHTPCYAPARATRPSSPPWPPWPQEPPCPYQGREQPQKRWCFAAIPPLCPSCVTSRGPVHPLPARPPPPPHRWRPVQPAGPASSTPTLGHQPPAALGSGTGGDAPMTR